MKKFLLYLVLIVAVIIVLVKIDLSLKDWAFIFSGLLFLRLLRLAFKSPDDDDLGYKLANGMSHLAGQEISWWHERLYIASQDYTSGSIKALIYKWGVTILGVISLLYLIIVGAVWLLCQPVFWIVVGSIVAVIVIIFVGFCIWDNKQQKKAAEEERVRAAFEEKCNNLVDEFVNTANIPMPSGAISAENIDYCEDAIQKIKTLKEEVSNADGENYPSLKRELTDKQLEVFYKVSVVSQAKNLIEEFPEVKQEMDDTLAKAMEEKNYNLLRRITDDDVKVNEEISRKLAGYKKSLKVNTISPYLDELEKYKDMDTTTMGGLMTSSSKLAEKASALKEIFNAAEEKYSELSDIRNGVNCFLELVRVNAYEYIYRGVELINFIRENAGGKTLSKATDMVEMDLNLDGMDLSFAGQDSDIKGLAINSLTSLIEKFDTDDGFASYAVNNPKEALGNEALEFIGKAIRDRNEAINTNNEAIAQVIEKLPEMVDAYTAGQAQLLRAIEIIKALIKANTGFAEIYKPLYETVFVKNDIGAVTMKDIQILASALKEFNSIAKTQL